MNPNDQQNYQAQAPNPNLPPGYPPQGQPIPGAQQAPLPPGYGPSDPGSLSGQPPPGYGYPPQGQQGYSMPPNSASPQQPLANGKPAVNPNSTQNNLQIAEIRDGIVIMNDGSYRSVIMVKSINFDLMSPQERESVEFSYQGFLNSLYFPIQIFIRSQKIDLREYIEKLDKIRSEHENMLLAVLMDDYINYIDMIASQTNIMDKRFYVVIPYFPVVEETKPITSSKNLLDGVFGLFSSTKTHIVINEQKLEEAKTELRNRVQATLSGLMQCGIQGLPLDTQELIELYYDSYNPDTATRQQLKNFDDLTAPVITKGEGQAPQPNLDRELL